MIKKIFVIFFLFLSISIAQEHFVLGIDDPSTAQYSLADMNSDGVLNILDVILLVNEVIGD